jgi:hypothetical protein
MPAIAPTSWKRTEVRCLAGYKANESPLSFLLDERGIEVRSILASWRNQIASNAIAARVMMVGTLWALTFKVTDRPEPKGRREPARELAAGPVDREVGHGVQSTMNSFAPVGVNERWGSASSAT